MSSAAISGLSHSNGDGLGGQGGLLFHVTLLYIFDVAFIEGRIFKMLIQSIRDITLCTWHVRLQTDTRFARSEYVYLT